MKLNLSLSGKRKLCFGGAALGILTAALFLGGMDCFAFLREHTEDILRSIVYITAVFCGFNAAEHFAKNGKKVK